MTALERLAAARAYLAERSIKPRVQIGVSCYLHEPIRCARTLRELGINPEDLEIAVYSGARDSEIENLRRLMEGKS